MTSSSDWLSLNNPTSQQQLAEDPWLTGNFQMHGGNTKNSPSRTTLYQIAKLLKITGRSKMTRAELVKTIRDTIHER